MAFAPIALTIPQYEDFPNQFLKAFDQGTTTPLAMATDAGGLTTLAKVQLDSSGFPITAGLARFIPFIDGDYDLWLFPTAVEADANDTSNAIQFADDLNADPLSGGASVAGNDKRYGPLFTLVSAAIAASPVGVDGIGVTLVSGMTVLTQGRTSIGDGGAAEYLVMTLAAYGLTPDEQGAAFTADNGLVLVLQMSGTTNLVKFGGVGDASTDNVAALDAAFAAIIAAGGGELFVPPGQFNYTTLATVSHSNIGIRISGMGRISRLHCTDATSTRGMRFESGGDFSLNIIQGVWFSGVSTCGNLVEVHKWFRSSVIRDCVFSGAEGSGIFALRIEHSLSMRLDNLYIADCFHGVQLAGASDAVSTNNIVVYRIDDATGIAIETVALTNGAETDRTPQGMNFNDTYVFVDTKNGAAGFVIRSGQRVTINKFWGEKVAFGFRFIEQATNTFNNNNAILSGFKRGGSDSYDNTVDDMDDSLIICDETISLFSTCINNKLIVKSSTNVTDNSANKSNMIIASSGNNVLDNANAPYAEVKLLKSGTLQQVIADDAAFEITDATNIGTMQFTTSTDGSGIVVFHRLDTGIMTTITSAWGGVTISTGTTSSDPTGTSGPDAQINVRVQVTSDTLWIENRSGASLTFQITLSNNFGT